MEDSGLANEMKSENKKMAKEAKKTLKKQLAGTFTKKKPTIVDMLKKNINEKLD